MRRSPVSRLLLLLVSVLVLLVAGAIGSPQKPGVAADQGIVILPVDPCELLSNGRTGRQSGDGFDRNSLQVLALGCSSRAKRGAYSSEYDAELPKARDARHLFQTIFKLQNNFIYPGTKWCGPGNIARNYWDLGKLANEDRCCREHDHCPQHISANRCKNGLCNDSPFTRSHCACDESFRACLQALKSPAADNIGSLYFNFGIICFAEEEEKNDVPTNIGDAGIEERSGLDSTGRKYGGGMKDASRQLDCSGQQNCRYKFYAQRRYTATADIDNIIPKLAERTGIQAPNGGSYQLNLAKEKRSSAEDVDHRAAELLSKFIHHFLRSTGVIRAKV